MTQNLLTTAFGPYTNDVATAKQMQVHDIIVIPTDYPPRAHLSYSQRWLADTTNKNLAPALHQLYAGYSELQQGEQHAAVLQDQLAQDAKRERNVCATTLVTTGFAETLNKLGPDTPYDGGISMALTLIGLASAYGWYTRHHDQKAHVNSAHKHRATAAIADGNMTVVETAARKIGHPVTETLHAPIY